MVNKNQYTWAEIIPVIDETDTLILLQTLQCNGLPQSAEDRNALLTRFRIKHPGDYPVTYEGLCEFSEAFAMAYPKSFIIRLIQQVITGTQPYQMEINHADIYEEEKALLLFVLPMPKTLEKSMEEEIIEER